MNKKQTILLSVIVLTLALPVLRPQPAAAQSDGVIFPETGKTIKGAFLRYWSSTGATIRYGLPITNDLEETSSLDGKTYTMQYFERAVFEAHPGNLPPYDVLLSLLGTFLYEQRYPNGAPNQMPSNTPDARFFPETGKHAGCQFLNYWQGNGGLLRFGYPVSDEMIEKSEVDGSPVRVQYFQRAVLVYDVEAIAHFRGDPGYVTVPDMGASQLSAKTGSNAPNLFATKPLPTPTDACAPTPHGPSYGDSQPDPPERASVGKGLIVKGTVKSSNGCTPINHARVVYFLAGPDGEYDAAHEGKVFTDSNGDYGMETNFPGFYGVGGPHVHLYVDAPGYRGMELEIYVACGQTEGTFDVVLAPQ